MILCKTAASFGCLGKASAQQKMLPWYEDMADVDEIG